MAASHPASWPDTKTSLEGTETYGVPRLMRAGLGNMLFPWARCVIFCRQTGARMLAPNWRKMRIGRYLRREQDKRRYGRLFVTGECVTGAERVFVILTSRHRSESELRTGWVPTGRELIRFDLLRDFFAPLRGSEQLVHAEITRITREELLPRTPSEPFIGVHVRLGDYPWRLPLEWYADAVASLRAQLGGLRVRVFSDGANEELGPLLRLPDTERVRGQSAITDLLDLARACCLVPSSSTFSLWASYLGRVPAVWRPGCRTERLRDAVLSWGGEPEDLRPLLDDGLELEWDGKRNLPATFMAAVQAKASMPGTSA